MVSLVKHGLFIYNVNFWIKMIVQILIELIKGIIQLVKVCTNVEGSIFAQPQDPIQYMNALISTLRLSRSNLEVVLQCKNHCLLFRPLFKPSECKIFWWFKCNSLILVHLFFLCYCTTVTSSSTYVEFLSVDVGNKITIFKMSKPNVYLEI